MDRFGIATAGCWIVDRVKLISHWPEQDTLTFIDAERRGGGGGAYNCLLDLHQMGVGLPLAGLGCVGDDADGAWLRGELAARELSVDWLHAVPGVPTSYTDVMSDERTGRRTFFHQRGANAAFGPEHVPFDALTARVVHLAYLLLLPTLDAEDPEFGSVGARVLAELSRRGVLTSLDLISEEGDTIQRVVLPALPYVDCLVINDFEAHALTGAVTRFGNGRANGPGLRSAAQKLLAAGVRQLVVLHLPEGGYARTAAGEELFAPSPRLPDGFIQGATGAGDAFAAGVLYGLHEGWGLAEMLQLALAGATACLTDPTATGGVGAMADNLALLARYPRREPLL